SPNIGGGLTYAKCRYVSLYGPITTEWRSNGDESVELYVTIPPNTTANVALPFQTKDVEVTENDLPVHQSEGVVEEENQDGGLSYKIGSGSYYFKINQI